MVDLNLGGGRSNPFTGKEGVGDFFGPFFRVRFLTPNTSIRDEYQDGELVSAAELGTTAAEAISSQNGTDIKFSDNNVGQLRSFASSLEIMDNGGGASIATLHLEPTYEDALAIVNDKAIQIGAVMVIEYGWLGQGSPAFGAGGEQISSDPHYYVIQQPSLSMNNLDISIDIIGADLFGYASTQRTSSRKWDRNDYPRDLDILEGLVKDTSLTVDTSLVTKQQVAFLPLGGAAPVAGTGSPLFETHPLKGEPQIVEQNDKDWIFFNTICASNNCSFFTIGDVIFIADMNVVMTKQPSYRLLMYQQPADDRDVPILSFGTNALTQMFFPAESRSTVATTIDPDTGEVTATKVDPATSTDIEHLGLKSNSGEGTADGVTISVADNKSIIPNPKFKEDQSGKTFSVPYSINNRGEMERQPTRAGEFLANTDATVTIPGLPTIVPMMLVEIAGTGVFNGVYVVMSAKHRLDTGGYETELALTRNTTSADTEVGKGQQPTKTNNPKTDKTGDEAAIPADPGDVF
jgi:hypothetical protein